MCGRLRRQWRLVDVEPHPLRDARMFSHQPGRPDDFLHVRERRVLLHESRELAHPPAKVNELLADLERERDRDVDAKRRVVILLEFPVQHLLRAERHALRRLDDVLALLALFLPEVLVEPLGHFRVVVDVLKRLGEHGRGHVGERLVVLPEQRGHLLEDRRHHVLMAPEEARGRHAGPSQPFLARLRGIGRGSHVLKLALEALQQLGMRESLRHGAPVSSFGVHMPTG